MQAQFVRSQQACDRGMVIERSFQGIYIQLPTSPDQPYPYMFVPAQTVCSGPASAPPAWACPWARGRCVRAAHFFLLSARQVRVLRPAGMFGSRKNAQIVVAFSAADVGGLDAAFVEQVRPFTAVSTRGRSVASVG